MVQRLTQARQRFHAQAAQLESLSPLNVLARGYSLTRVEADQTVVRSPKQVRPGDRIVTLLRDGTIVSRVEELREVNA
jgi:exodeoxyribonuclease VII large subunit